MICEIAMAYAYSEGCLEDDAVVGKTDHFTRWRHKKENILHIFTGPLWEEFSGYRLIPLTKASDAELWCFLWSAPEQTVEQTIKTPVIWDAIALIMMPL